MKADININTVPITFQDTMYSDKLKSPKTHPDQYKAVYVNVLTGEIYSNDLVEGGTPGEGGVTVDSTEIFSPYNQNMLAENTYYDGSLACSTPLIRDPAGTVSVSINGLQVTTGEGMESYFSSDGGLTAITVGEEGTSNLLYWNSSIAGYELEDDDVVQFDYIIRTNSSTPTITLTITGGSWGSYVPDSYSIEATEYAESPLESWKFELDVNNYIELSALESAIELVEIAKVCINSDIQFYSLSYPIDEITTDQKKIVNQLFKTYTYGGVTLELIRGTNWTSFSIE